MVHRLSPLICLDHPIRQLILLFRSSTAESGRNNFDSVDRNPKRAKMVSKTRTKAYFGVSESRDGELMQLL